MKKKWTLLAGITLLLTGIILRFTGMENYLYIPFMAAGGLLKIYYITSQIITGTYKPGYEILFLILGLMLFFSGIALKHTLHESTYFFLILPGLALKFIFVLAFIRCIRLNRAEF